MNFFNVLIDHSHSGTLVPAVSSQLDLGPTKSILHVERIYKFPSKIIHNKIMYTKSVSLTHVVLINPTVTSISPELFNYLSQWTNKPCVVVPISADLNVHSHYPQLINLKGGKLGQYDIVMFQRDLYRGLLANMSLHLNYGECVNTILQSIKQIYITGRDPLDLTSYVYKPHPKMVKPSVVSPEKIPRQPREAFTGSSETISTINEIDNIEAIDISEIEL